MVSVEEEGVSGVQQTVMSADGQQQQSVFEEEPDKPPEAPAPPAMAMPLPEELMSSVLVFLRMKDMLEWRVVSSSTKSM